MKNLSILLLINILLSNICYADDVIFLEKNKPVPYDGYLFTPEKTKDTRIKLLERNTFEGLNESLTKTNTFLQENSSLKDQQIKIVMDRNDQLSKSLMEAKSTSNLERILYFALGIIVAGGAVYGAKKITQ